MGDVKRKRETKTFDTIGPDHAISKVANALSDQAFELSAKMGISRWDLCVAMANAIGQILADSGKQPPEGVIMPTKTPSLDRDQSIERIGDLQQVMIGAYDLRNIEGTG